MRQLSLSNNKIIQLGTVKVVLRPQFRVFFGVAAATQSVGIEITEFIKYFDYVSCTCIVLKTVWGVLDRSVLVVRLSPSR